MGNFDKVVVLVVLFLVAIVLGVSMSGPDRGVEAADVEGEVATNPLDSLRGNGATVADKVEVGLDEAAQRRRDGDRPLLHSAVANEASEEEAGESPVAHEEVRTPKRILLKLRGLEPSWTDSYYTYAWREGDTWASVATEYYGRAAYGSLLSTQNEGPAPRVGQKILIPVRDLRREAGTREPARTAARGSNGEATPAGANTEVTDTEVTNTAGGGEGDRIEPSDELVIGPEEEEIPSPSTVDTYSGSGGWYTVREGQTLSHVSLAVYGTATRWKTIFDANTDALPDPDTVREGMNLRIPSLEGALPADRPRVQ